MMPANKNTVLMIIVVSQFMCTTTWFGGNAVLNDLSKTLALPSSALAWLTSAVQFGFIIGTLAYALLTIADRFKPSSVFLVNAIAAALVNACTNLCTDLTAILALRFCTGFFLAGIYPVGMKIAADHFDKGLGKALGFLVGALVLGTSFPHLLKSLAIWLSWKTVLLSVSALSIVGGLMVWLFVPEGPYRKKMDKPHFGDAFKVFRSGSFRSVAFGYFGHMWELYTFWALVPLIIKSYADQHNITFNISFISFFVIGIGSVACIVSGYASQFIGAKRIATIALLCSCTCCLLSPFIFSVSVTAFICFLLFWGAMVIADSPMFSTLVAQNASVELKGTALTLVTSIGFFITIVSMQVLDGLNYLMDTRYLFMILAIGPFLGLIAMTFKTTTKKL